MTSYSRGTSETSVVLPAPDAPTRATVSPGRDVEADAVEDVAVGVGRRRVLLERGDRRVGRRRVAEAHVVERHPPDRLDEVDGAGPLADRLVRVEHLEDPLEADHRRHQVDPGVRQPGQRLVHAGDEGGEGDERARRQLAGHDEVAADAVDRRRADGADEAEGDEEHPSVHRRADAGVADAGGVALEGVVLAPVVAEQLDEHRPGDVEALGHLRAHRRVVLHLLAGDLLQPPADAPGRDDEQRQHDERQQRQPPLEGEHRRPAS